ncbi:hypothetical protein AQS8620_01419 [Aquimixticola soesokkakensis]|uniref:Uncharacterized protein n=1 Tax=Aquimixticola soesokkakensis TaxID=1519096 RepID=A0A1Y5SD69_9RHOB|nr:hypothetical protein [Aquimixticola soesokkakensis]SLN38073.1 hypothetical protein AQS8620_01419 [Aquimixticola soesokkakensis]
MTNYILAQTSTYWWPVTVRCPDPTTPGKFVKRTFEAEFEFRHQDQLIEEEERVRNAVGQRAQIAAERANLVGRICGWRGVKDVLGDDVAFTKERLAAEMGNSLFRIGVYEAIRESMSGEEALLGN